MKTDRRCVICPVRFIPKQKAQLACGHACARTLAGRTLASRYPAPFAAEIAKRKADGKRRVEALCHRRWPELSVREIEIFNFAVKHGYTRGYNVGYHSVKRRYRRQNATT